MNIQSLSNRPREINVTEPVSLAYERMKLMLFSPFDLGKWFTLGFCAWLAGLGETGGGFGTGSQNFSNQNGRPTEELRHFYHEARNFVMVNLYWIVPVAVVVVLVSMALGVLILWLNSRGKFMFLHCVARNKAEVSEPWEIYARQANSLFWFRIVMGLTGMILFLPLVVFIGLTILQMVRQGEANFAGVMLAVATGLLCLLLAVVFGIIRKFLVDFVVPIMFLRQGKCLAAWRELFGLLTANFGQFVLYILFQIVLAMAIGTLVVFAVLLTCCLAGCLMMLPYIGTVLLLPVLVFKRAYSLYYLAQYGPQYDAFAGAT